MDQPVPIGQTRTFFVNFVRQFRVRGQNLGHSGSDRWNRDLGGQNSGSDIRTKFFPHQLEGPKRVNDAMCKSGRYDLDFFVENESAEEMTV